MLAADSNTFASIWYYSVGMIVWTVHVLQSSRLRFHRGRWSSGLDTGVEESIDVNDVLEEAPLGMGARLSIYVVLNSLVKLLPLMGLELNGLGLLNGGESNDSNNKVLEHFN